MNRFEFGDWSSATIAWSRIGKNAAETQFNGTGWVLLKRSRRINGAHRGWYLHTDPPSEGRWMGSRYGDAVHLANQTILLTEFAWLRQVVAEIAKTVGGGLIGAVAPLDALKAVETLCLAEGVAPLALVRREVAPETCYACGSAEVVHHNFMNVPFCRPCADGDGVTSDGCGSAVRARL